MSEFCISRASSTKRRAQRRTSLPAPVKTKGREPLSSNGLPNFSSNFSTVCDTADCDTPNSLDAAVKLPRSATLMKVKNADG
ncbi:hypothetical protein [Turicimonas muris]|uniref:hypothetical protein n=1 Tax=uncultured Turicimonas sp. TaxID=1918607 RepID=UPI0025B5CC8F|nr:hypothetical protein [Turicimonas muris]